MSGTTRSFNFRIGFESEDADAKVKRLERSFASLEKSVGTASSLMAAHERQIQVVTRAVQAGTITQERADQVLQRLQQRYEQQARALEGGASAAAGWTRNIGQAGFQIQDFAVQVQSGTSALVALSQQGSQLLGVFGTGGAIAGAALTVGLLAGQLIDTAINGRDLDTVLKELEASSKALDAAANVRFENLDKEAERVDRLREYYRRLTEQQLAGERIALAKEQRDLQQSSKSLFSDITSEGLISRLSRSVQSSDSGLLSSGALEAERAANNARAQAQQIIENLRTAGDLSREAISGAVAQLDALSRSGTTADATIAGFRDRLLESTQKLIEYGDKAGTLTERQRLLDEATGRAGATITGAGNAAGGAAPQFDALGEAASRASAKLSDLQAQGARAAAAPGEALANAQTLLRTLETQGTKAAEALQRQQQAAASLDDRVGRQLADEEKNTRAVIKAQAELLQQNGQREEAIRLLGTADAEAARLRAEREPIVRQQLAETDRVTQQYAQRREEIRKREQEAEAAVRRERTAGIAQLKQDAADAARIWDTLRRDGQSGLLLGSEGDANALKAINAALKGSALDPEVRKRAEKDAADALRKQESESRRTTDDIVRYGTEAFADMFDSNSRGWSGMLDTFEHAAIRTFARIGSEAVIRPVVTPIVEGVLGAGSSGIGGSLAASLGLTGSSSGFNLGTLSSTLGLGNSLGLGDALGLGGIGSSLGLTSLAATPLWSAPGAMSVAELLAAGPATGASLAPSAASVSLGGVLGGAGLGFAAGSLLNSLVGGKSTGGMVGSGAGALAGAAIGSIVPGLGTLVGGLIGGAGGGLLGGLVGPGPKHPAGNANIAIDESGRLVIGDTSSKNLNIDEQVAATQQALDQLNASIKNLGLTLNTAPGGFANIHYGSDASAEDQPLLERGILERLRADSAEAAKIIADELAKGTEAKLQTAIDNVAWLKNTFEPLTAAAESANQFAESMKALRQPYDEAIAKATELGLSITTLAEREKTATDTLIAQRDRQLKDMLQSVDDRILVASGGDTLDRRLQEFYRQQDAARVASAEQVRALGAGEDVVNKLLTGMVKAAELEAQNLRDQEAANRANAELTALQTLGRQGSILTGFLDSQAVSAASPQNSFAAAQEQYYRALRAARSAPPETADLSALTQAADTLLRANTAFNGEGAQSALVRSGVERELRSLGADLNLPQFNDRFDATVDRMIVAQNDNAAQFRANTAAVDALREEFREWRLANQR
jgi:hypothetical protein